MTDTTAQEPTMEEILASIRRIISEDDAPAAEAAPAPAPAPSPTLVPTPSPVTEPVASPALIDETPSMQEAASVSTDEDEIFDLTDRYQAPAHESIGDLDLGPAEVEPEPFPTAFQPEPEPVSHDPAPSASSVAYDSLVGDSAAASASSAFAGLAASLKQPEPTPSGGSGATIDDLARSLMRPLLKEWLDTNLPGIVEAAVKKEVERIARNAG